MWIGFTFNLCVGLLYAAFLLRAVRRYERTADRLMARMDETFEREMQKYDDTRDEIRASMRATMDAMLVEEQLKSQPNEDVETEDLLRYVDFSRPELAEIVPTQAEIRTLPRGARIAFTTRCARRSSRLYKHFWPKASAKHLTAIEEAILAAESGDATASSTATSAALAAYAAAADAYLADDATADAAFAAFAAAFAAVDVTDAQAITDFIFVPNSPWPIVPQLRRDFETVYGLALANAWTDTTPVPPSVFGPLWPQGTPEGWPTTESPATELHCELPIPDDMTTADAIEFVKLLSLELSKLHVAGGGHGVTIQPPMGILDVVTAKNPSPAPVLV